MINYIDHGPEALQPEEKSFTDSVDLEHFEREDHRTQRAKSWVGPQRSDVRAVAEGRVAGVPRTERHKSPSTERAFRRRANRCGNRPFPEI